MKNDCFIKNKAEGGGKDLFKIKKGGRISVVETGSSWSQVVKGKIVPEGYIEKACYQ
jgi:hypothetical protein